MSSSRTTNNSTTNQSYREYLQIYGSYAPNNYEQNHSISGFQDHGATPRNQSGRSAMDRWLTAPNMERAIAQPFGLTRTTSTLLSPVQILVLNSLAARDVNPISRILFPNSSPMLSTRQNMSVPTQEESRLTKDEQKIVLDKLKKEIYNPTPKNIIRRLSLYYRDNAKSSSTEKYKEKDEDEKNCVICLEDFEPRQVVTLTPCSHMFHEECIVPWVTCHGQCPVCRFAICDRIRGGAVAINNNQENVIANDPSARVLMSVMRAMEEPVAWRNIRDLH